MTDKTPKTPADFLEQAMAEMERRAQYYDAPTGERSIPATVKAFNAVTGDGQMDSAERGWLFMELLKMVRSQQGGYRADNYVDGVAYSSLRAEAAVQEHEACQAFEPDIRQGWLKAAAEEMHKAAQVRGVEDAPYMPFKEGQQVRKVVGDYSFHGPVVGVMVKQDGQVRYAVENPEGILHIFSAKQLEAV